ncbi:MAG: DNA alkylation repair protein [Johnsonella sp.]|nr:DNA alkylation repair protein [Johnsonella sp.]
MAKKLKDYYDETYVYELAEEIYLRNKEFNKDGFIRKSISSLNELEFGDRQSLIAKSIRENMNQSYQETISVFYQMLGEELEGTIGAFTEGWRLWPLGKYVELYGTEDYPLSIEFSKELTKRFTSEYCMRPLIEYKPEESFAILKEWSLDENPRVRRLASECMRIRLPWAKKSVIALQHFDSYLRVLENLRDDRDKAIQKSVANNLNDLYKEDPKKFDSIISEWKKNCNSDACAWIIKHASRTKEKMKKS